MYRSEVEVLRARVRDLERDLAGTKEDNAKLRRRIDAILNPPPPPKPPPEPGVEVLKARAFRFAYSVLAITLIAAIWAGLRGIGLVGYRFEPGLALVALWLVAFGLGIHHANKPIKKSTGYDGGAMIFVTWFWLPFCLAFPGLGALIGIGRSIILLRGKFPASTITSNGSSTHWDAKHMQHGEGRPAALLFLCCAAIQPVAYFMFQ